ncbi:hypothetical protein [Helicobacter cetorum]|uniref:Uncharacterized protein n=1 Tax=Helicobacter cetorum TaxID=138563 RepID=A7LH09_9HELI|nr:hypothetical protein [Helicobacter cetorum]ABS86829.1 hypothetical protein pz32w [Helicobacter cetorum]
MKKLKDFFNKHPESVFPLCVFILIVLLVINHIDRAIGSLANALAMLIFTFLYTRNIR